jgi:hypothetical protein
MNTCNNYTLENQIILILCYRRTFHLSQVISALEDAYLVDTFTVIFVIQDPIDSVLEIINSSTIQNKILTYTDGANYSSPAQAINGNLAHGLSFAFDKLSADLVVVLEDDIVISKDALCFFRQVTKSHLGHKKFRGVNGFSREVADPFFKNEYLRLNFGLAWGWAIPKRTYMRLIRFWDGNENNHWDFIFEPYIRTGYVVNPFRSRVLNIGFDESATHTSGDAVLGSEMQRSFAAETPRHVCDITEMSHSYTWAPGAINLSIVSPFTSGLIFALRTILFYIFIRDTESKSNYLGIKRRILKYVKPLA